MWESDKRLILCICQSFVVYLLMNFFEWFWFKYYSSNPPGFAFVLYKYGEDADTAVRSKFNFEREMLVFKKVFYLDMDGRYVQESEVDFIFFWI